MADGWGEEANAQKNQNWGYYEAKCLVEIWADEEVQRQSLAMGRKQNMWENIATENLCEYSLKSTYNVKNSVTNMLGKACFLYSHVSALMWTQFYLFDLSFPQMYLETWT